MTGRRLHWLAALAPAVILALLPALAAAAPDITEKAQLCATCHGEAGVPIDKSIPVIWGQQAGYIYIQLRDIKRGTRANETMAPMVADLSREDMLALAEYFAKQSWPVTPKPATPAETVHRAETLAGAGQCTQCHLGGYLGASTAPRLANQGQDYLRATMLAFRSSARANNGWMTALLQSFSDDDIAALAAYLAGL